jgi:RNA polymerase sigma factor (TIGR02999 family)
MMRNILVDYARNRKAAKRGGGAQRLTPGAHQPAVDLVALDDALKLARLDGRQGRLIELRYFDALSIDGTAEVMGVSPATVKREWATTRAWLERELRNART